MQIKKPSPIWTGEKHFCFIAFETFLFQDCHLNNAERRRLNIDRQNARESGRGGTARSIFDEVDQSTATLAATTGVSAFLFKFNTLFIF